MNPNNLKGKNYIFVSTTGEDYISNFINAAITLVKEQKVALIFLRTHVEFVPALVGMNKREMHNLIISYQSDVDGVIKKLLELHEWTILPDFVLLNLNAYFDVPSGRVTLKSLYLCIATLLSYMRAVERQKSLKGSLGDFGPNSLVLLNSREDVQISSIIDFYFYKSAVFTAFDVVKSEVFEKYNRL